MRPPAWLPLLAALACAAPERPDPAAPSAVWIDVAPARLAAAAVGNASWTWPGDEVAALDDAGRLHLIVREEGRVRVLTGEVGVSLPARVLVADLQQRVIGPEVYAIGRDGDVWQVEPLPSSGALKVVRLAGELPASPRALLAGEFRLSQNFAQLLVVDSQGAYGVWRVDDSGTLRREDMRLDLPPATSVLHHDRSLERAIVFGRGHVDGLSLVDDQGRFWSPWELPERGPDDGMRLSAIGLGRLLCWGVTRRGQHAALFDQLPDGAVRGMYVSDDGSSSRLELVFTGAPVAGAFVPEGLHELDEDRLWTLDARSTLRRSAHGPSGDGGWSTEVVRRGPSPAAGLFELRLDDGQRPAETRLIAAWGSRVVDLGAP